jgi:aspartyl-tRNA(Asn)/glutamyl-tRNA(Gln) amidotransferase subunit B
MRVQDWVDGIRAILPELPDARRKRFISDYNIADTHAKALTSDIRVADFYESVAKDVNPIVAAAWVADILKGELNYRDLDVSSFKVEDMVTIIDLVTADKITEKSGVDLIRTILDEGGSPNSIVEKKGLVKVEGDIVSKAISEAIEENPEALQDFLAGKEKSLNFLVGQVMKKTCGRADARNARELLLRELGIDQK